MIDSRAIYRALFCQAFVACAIIAGCESPTGGIPTYSTLHRELVDTLIAYPDSLFDIDLSSLPQCDTSMNLGTVGSVQLRNAEFVLLDPSGSYSAIDSMVVRGIAGRTSAQPDSSTTVEMLQYPGAGSAMEFCEPEQRKLSIELHFRLPPVRPMRIRVRLLFDVLTVDGYYAKSGFLHDENRAFLLATDN